jgi:hypothetical protein
MVYPRIERRVKCSSPNGNINLDSPVAKEHFCRIGHHSYNGLIVRIAQRPGTIAKLNTCGRAMKFMIIVGVSKPFDASTCSGLRWARCFLGKRL